MTKIPFKNNRNPDTPRTLRHRLKAPIAAGILAMTSCSVLALTPAMVAAQQQEGNVLGRVTDESGQIGFAGAIVSIPDLGIETTSERDGRFRFREVPAGTYTLRIKYIGAQTMEREITVAPGESERQTFALSAYGTMEEIRVYGQVAQIRDALNRKRSADIIQDGVSADAIGQMADQNVTEAARRITGVSITTDQGEGRFISIRGSNPNLNSVSINGLRVPSAAGDERQVAMDVIPSELLSGIDITKTVTPDMDGDAVGGSIEVQTFSALDRDGTFISGTAEGSYNDKSGEVSPKGSLTFMDKYEVGGEDEIGIALSANWFDRKFEVDGVEAGDGWEMGDLDGQEARYPALVEQRDYTINRERIGLAANVDYRIGATTELYFRSLYSRFKDSEVNPNNIFEVDDGDFEELSDSGALVSGDYVYDKELGQRTETQTIWSISVGGESSIDDWTVDYQLGYSKARENNPNAMDALFESDFASDVFVGYGFGDDRRIPLIVSNNMAAVNDPDNYELSEVAIEASTANDEEWSAELNNKYEFTIDDIPAFIKTGGKVRLRDKSQNEDVIAYEGFPGDPALSSLLADPFDYSLGDFGPQPDAGSIRKFLSDNEGDLEINQEDSDIDSRAADFEMQEDIYAAYVMGQIAFTNLRLVGGVRMEHTRFKSAGTELVENEDTDSIELLPVNEQNSYTDWMPSLGARYDMNDKVIMHAGYSQTLARPNFADIAPIAERSISDGEFEGAFGNPDLEPYSSENFDISIEFYPGELGLISFAAFYKDIKNFVVAANLAGTPGRFENFDEAIVPINGETASLKGLEFGYQQQLSFLPEPFDGFLINANYTYVDSSADLALGDRKIPLPGQSKHVYNASLGYEKGPFSARYALSYRSSYLDELEDPEDPDFDRYQSGYLLMDVTAQYQITENIKVFGKVQNLNGRPQYFYFMDRNHNAQYDSIGLTANVGLTATY